MTWTAPEVTRSRPPQVGDERELLDTYLEWHRQTLLHKCSGLTGEQLRRRAVEPSDLSLLGLVRHMTNVERGWFWDFAGQLKILHWTGRSLSDWTDFSGVDDADPAADIAAYLETCDRSRALVAGADLADTFVEEGGTGVFSLRFVYLHTLEEYSRHNGHADLLRERIDGATGQ
ncbi:MAG: DinB family protein [Natronosporangium sp.]